MVTYIYHIQKIIRGLEKESQKKFDNKITKLIKDLKTIKEKKLSIKTTIENIRQQEIIINDNQNELNQIVQKIKQEQESKFDKTIYNTSTKKIIDLDHHISVVNNDISKLQNLHKIVTFWKEGFSSTGIPSMLIDDSIPFMNKQVSYYLDKLSNGRYIVSFDTLDKTKKGEYRDKISVNVVDTETKANKRVQLSGGQTRLIDIATILTLGDLQSNIQNVSFNLLLFDEIFDSLDDQNVEYVSKVMRILTKIRSIFIISHKYVDQLEADDVYNFN